MDSKAHFDISAFVVKQLGEELVSDEVTAIVELVKNAYDADAKFANVIVDTKNVIDGENVYFSPENGYPTSKGYVIIEDGGIGMTESEIKKGWLTISYSHKRHMRERGILTPGGRTPLGEKGLGRLSTQRLGSKLEMITHKDKVIVEDEELQAEIDRENNERIEHHVAFSWNDFKEDIELTAVPVWLDSSPKNSPRKGTKLIITDLRDPSIWERDIAKKDLVNRLSQLIFPFGQVRPFNIFLTINGEEIRLDNISDSLRELAVSKYSFEFDGKTFRIRGKIRLSRMQGSAKGDESLIYQHYIAPDLGKSFYSFLTSKSNEYRLSNIKYLGKDGWFISFEEERELTSIGELSLVNENGEPVIANPGKFRGEIDEFFLRNIDVGRAFGKFDDYKKFVSNHTGIRIFRDGFGILPYGVKEENRDWLGLSSGQTSGLSFYLPRPDNVMGFIELSAKDNSRLQEKTDREGFITSPYSRNFFLLMDQVVKILSRFFNNYGRSLNKFRQSQAENLTAFTSTKSQIEEIKKVSVDSQIIEQKVEALSKNLEAVTSSIESAVDRVANTPLLASKQELEFQSLLGETRAKLSEAQDLVVHLRLLLEQTKRLGYIADAIEPKIKILEEQLDQFSELAALGLIAEALSHETNTIADRLAEQTKMLIVGLKAKKTIDVEILTYTEYVQSAISALRKQLNHQAPSLKYLRETKDTFSTRVYFDELRSYYTEGRFQDSKIQIVLDEPFEDFKIQINKGKLTQVVDNLFLNSEYWLKEYVRRGELVAPVISVKSQKPFVLISDNGLGIEPSIEDALFQPFVTTKPKSIGRGLGLFIIRELLDSSNCTIELMPDRNLHGRRYIFQLNLTGVLNG